MNLIPDINRKLRLIGVLILVASLTGCLYWLRLYQVYLQLNQFDENFSISTEQNFTLHFNHPLLQDSDFIDLARLYPTENNPDKNGRQWRYWFRKVDTHGKVIIPEIKFYSELSFNEDKKLVAWTFSSLFLAMTPPKFLEISLRSIAGANIDKENKQLKANTDLIGKINAPLPKQTQIIAQLGAPLEIKDEPEQEVYVYHFLLDSPRIESGYESNALNEVKLSFDKKTHELFNMAGNFAGLKISIDYRKFLESSQK